MTQINGKRSWWDIRGKSDDASRSKHYNEFIARILPPDEAARYDVELPQSWKGTPSFLNRVIGGKRVPNTGVGFVQSPWADLYTKVYGVTPIADLPEYRTMYRTQPDIKKAIDLIVNLSVGKGLSVHHDKKRVAKYLEEVIDKIDLLENLQIVARDMLTYGSAYLEVLWTEREFKNVDVSISGENVTVSNITKKSNGGIEGLKPLDPVYMRVRRDAFGAVFGYIQWMGYPPVLLDTDVCLQFKNTPNSTGYESAYGVSQLMPLLRNNDLLKQFENDAAIWIHSRAVPPLIITGGSDPKHPLRTDQMTDLMSKFKSRGPASSIFVKSDVNVVEMRGAASDINIQWWIDYLLERRRAALGVPGIFLGRPEGSNRSTSDTEMQEFVSRLTILQDQISDKIVTFILHPLIKAKFGESVERPELEWKPIIEEETNERAKRILDALKWGMISVNEARKGLGYIQITPDMPFYDEVFDTPRPPIQFLPNQEGGSGGGGDNTNKPANNTGEKQKPGDKQNTGDNKQKPPKPSRKITDKEVDKDKRLEEISEEYRQDLTL